MKNPRYELYGSGSIWFVLDKEQDIFVTRQGYPDDLGFFTKTEAKAVLKHLQQK